MPRSIRWFHAIGMIVCSACLLTWGTAAGETQYLITNVAVVDVVAGRVVEPKSVHIVGERIANVGGGVEIHGDAQVIDGTGLYLVPGLFDAHVHLSASPETFGPMLIANGVTCVRDTGAPTQAILDLQSRALSGSDLLPQIVCTGAIVDGDPPIWPFSEACDEPDEARAAVRKLAEAGVDQIKVYSLLKKPVYEAAIAEAHRLGLRVTGHIPLQVSLDEAIAAGQDCVEHFTGFDREIARFTGWRPPEDADSPWIGFAAWGAYPEVTKEQLRDLGRRLKAAGMYQCPTIVVMRGIGRTSDPETANEDPRLAYVPSGTRSFWSGSRYQKMSTHWGAAVTHMQAMVGQLHRAGVPLMIGTDLANPYVFAGFSVHEEMELFQEAGIPPVDVLRAATIVPAKFCGVDDELGTIETGKVASLVLVKGNPLDDVRNLSRIEGVFVRGRYFNSTQRLDLLKEVKESVASLAPAAAATVDLSLPGEELYRGRFVLTFQKFDAGFEDFVITKDADGYHIKSHYQPKGGPQSPFVVTYHVDDEFAFRGAEYRTLTGKELVATYTRNGSTVTVRARRGKEALPEQVFVVPENSLFTGPVTASNFATIGDADLEVGESRTYQAIGFGYPSWQLTATEYELSRGQDTTLLHNGAEVPMRFYRSKLVTDWGDFRGETWTNKSGLTYLTILTMPFGTIEGRLEGVEK